MCDLALNTSALTGLLSLVGMQGVRVGERERDESRVREREKVMDGRRDGERERMMERMRDGEGERD